MITEKTVGPQPHDLVQLFLNLSIATLTIRNLYVCGFKGGLENGKCQFPQLFF